jgi:hypothetical protein
MEGRNDILQELGEISPYLARVPYRPNLQEVAEGYFAALPDLVMKRVRELAGQQTESVMPEVIGQAGKSLLFDLPATYFAQFPQAMMERIKAAEAPSSTEELEILSPLLSGMKRKAPFAVPTGYFSELPDNLVSGMQAVEFVKEELEELSPLLAGLRQQRCFDVPDGYFDSLAAKVLDQVKFRQPVGKVVTMGRTRAWLKYAAAAAAVVGLVVTLGIRQFNRAHASVVDPIASLTKVSDQEMANYLEYQDIPLPKSLDSVSAGQALAMSDINDNDLQELMGDVSDNELQQYAVDEIRSNDMKTN